MTGVADDALSTVIRFFRAVDAREWDVVTALLADVVASDYTSLFAGEPESVSGAELATRWQALLPGFDATQHFLGPLLVSGPDTVECNVRGYHVLGDEVWMVAGWYVLTVERGEGAAPVRISGITLVSSYETGPRELVERAQQRAAA